MKRILFFLISSGLILSSCSEEELRRGKISFAESTIEILESDGTLNSFHPAIFQNPQAKGKEFRVLLTSDKPVSEDVQISFFVQGTASELVGQTGVPDFAIPSGTKTVTMAKGTKEAEIVLTIYEDLDFEVYENSDPIETILITLNKIESGPADLVGEKFFVLNIKEDDAVLYLNWDANGVEPSNQSRGDVDMDLLITFEDELILTSAYEGTDPEFVTIPGGFPSGKYGFAYNYYSGSSDQVLFKVFVWNLGGALDGKYYNNLGGAPLVFTSNLGLADQFQWSQNNLPEIVQIMNKSGFDYTGITPIVNPNSGGRISLAPDEDSELKFNWDQFNFSRRSQRNTHKDRKD